MNITWRRSGSSLEVLLYEQLKFCEYWGYERALASHVVTHEFGIPSVAVARQHAPGGSGQLRTRVQAFVESLEMKQLRAAQKEDN